MPTEVSTLVANAECLDCGLSDGQKLSVLIYLFATIANVPTDASSLVAAAQCIDCAVPPGMRLSVLIALADTIATNGSTGGGGSGSVTCQAGVPAAPPTVACALSYDTTTGILYYWTGAAWAAVPAGGSGSVMCGAVPPVAAPTTGCALYYDTVSTALYYWDGAAWQLKV